MSEEPAGAETPATHLTDEALRQRGRRRARRVHRGRRGRNDRVRQPHGRAAVRVPARSSWSGGRSTSCSPTRCGPGTRQRRAEYVEHPQTRPMGAGLELRGQRRSGAEFPVEISLSPVRAGGHTLVVAIVRDITDRHIADEELRAGAGRPRARRRPGAHRPRSARHRHPTTLRGRALVAGRADPRGDRSGARTDPARRSTTSTRRSATSARRSSRSTPAGPAAPACATTCSRSPAKPPGRSGSSRPSRSTARSTARRATRCSEQLTATLREALSNVTKHARCVVTSGSRSIVRENELVLVVADNGVGHRRQPRVRQRLAEHARARRSARRRVRDRGRGRRAAGTRSCGTCRSTRTRERLIARPTRDQDDPSLPRRRPSRHRSSGRPVELPERRPPSRTIAASTLRTRDASRPSTAHAQPTRSAHHVHPRPAHGSPPTLCAITLGRDAAVLDQLGTRRLLARADDVVGAVEHARLELARTGRAPTVRRRRAERDASSAQRTPSSLRRRLRPRPGANGERDVDGVRAQRARRLVDEPTTRERRRARFVAPQHDVTGLGQLALAPRRPHRARSRAP